MKVSNGSDQVSRLRCYSAADIAPWAVVLDVAAALIDVEIAMDQDSSTKKIICRKVDVETA